MNKTNKQNINGLIGTENKLTSARGDSVWVARWKWWSDYAPKNEISLVTNNVWWLAEGKGGRDR